MGDLSCSLSAKTNGLHNDNVWPTELLRTHIGPEHPSDSRDHTKRFIDSNIRAAELLQEVHTVASLGYHVAMLVRSEQQQDYIFTERHLDLMIPVNNSNASCLQEIGQVGPRLLAHEVALSIQGVATDKELLFVRRLRAELPELIGFALTQDAVRLTFCGRKSQVNKTALKDLMKRVFGKETYLTFSKKALQESLSLSSRDRSLIRAAGAFAWKEPRESEAHRNQGTKQTGTFGRFVQSAIVNVPDTSIALVEEGPGVTSPHVSTLENSLNTCRVLRIKPSQKAYRDTARRAILSYRSDNQPHTPEIESLKISDRGHTLCITALVTSAATLPLSQGSIPQETARAKLKQLRAPFQVRMDLVQCDSEETHNAFAVVPPELGFGGLIQSPNGNDALLVCERPASASLSEQLYIDLKRTTGRRILDSKTRFSVLPPEDDLAVSITSLIPSGVGLTSIERCQVTGELQLHTVRPVSDETRAQIAEVAGCPVSATHSSASVPVIFQPYVNILSKSAAIKPTLSPIPASHLQNCTVLGGTTIGGSAVLFGEEILLDKGSYPNEASRRLELSESRLRQIKYVIISHAHVDHLADVIFLYLELQKIGRGKECQFIMPEPVALLLSLIIKEQMHRGEHSFHKDDVKELFGQIRLAPLDYPIALSPSVTLRVLHAGHHIGSTMSLLEERGPNGTRRVLYTADMRSDTDYGSSRLYPAATMPTDLDAIIIEATNGMLAKVSREEIEGELLEVIKQTTRQGGTVVLPVLASGRAQEVLTLLRKNVRYFQDAQVPIYVEGTSIYDNNTLFSYIAATYPKLLRISDLKTQGWRGVLDGEFQQVTGATRATLLKNPRPKVIVVSGGMGAGPSRDFIEAFGNSDKNKILFTCYQVENSYGATFLEQTKETGIASSYRLTGHNFGEDSLQFVARALKANGKVLITHGSAENKAALADHLVKFLRSQGHTGEVVIASEGASVEL